MATKKKEPVGDMDLLKKLECPFTWDMEAIAKHEQEKYQYHENDDEEYFPLMKLMRKIMTVYVDTYANKDRTRILENLAECEENILDIEERSNPEISAKVAKYVWQAIQCFVYKKFGMIDEMKKVFAEIENMKFRNSKEISTLIACKSICWSKYHRIGSYEAEKFIREAIKENPKCDLWYFILAKNLRRQRRDSSISAEPNAEETANFLKACELSKNPVYELFLAQMYREQNETQKAKSMYEKIFYDKPVGTTIMLRLALGFIRSRDFKKARVCLDKVGKKHPTNSMYLHYEGIYYMKQKMFQKASDFYNEAIKTYNISAEKEYLMCLLKIDRNYDITKYLLRMLNKYEDLPKHQLQPIILDLGFCFWKKKNDIEKALDYFLEAVEINPEARCMTDYFDYMNVMGGDFKYMNNREKNVFHTLKSEFLNIVYGKKSKYNEEILNKADNLAEHCDKYYSRQLSAVEDAISKFKL